jgi:hypothetical protein
MQGNRQLFWTDYLHFEERWQVNFHTAGVSFVDRLEGASKPNPASLDSDAAAGIVTRQAE